MEYCWATKMEEILYKYSLTDSEGILNYIWT